MGVVLKVTSDDAPVTVAEREKMLATVVERTAKGVR